MGGRRISLKRHEIRRALRPSSLWRSLVTVALISAFLAGGIGTVDGAPIYSPVFYYYHTGHLGSSNVLTDSNGALVQHYEYSTFGPVAYQNNTMAFPVSNRYTGQIADDSTGLYYYGGRYYDPQLGRFIQPDPVVPDATDSQSLNRYSYCRNNPLNETDPSGYDTSDVNDSCSVDYGNGIVADWNSSGGSLSASFFSSPINYATSFSDSSRSDTSWISSGGTSWISSGGSANSPVSTGPSETALFFQSVGENWLQNTGDYLMGAGQAVWGLLQMAARNANPALAAWDGAGLALTISRDPVGYFSNAWHDFTGSLETANGIGHVAVGVEMFFAGGGLAGAARATTAEGESIVAAETTAAPRFLVTESGVAVPTEAAELKANMQLLQDTSTSGKTAIARKFVGTDSQGPLRVRIEQAHPSTPGYSGPIDPLHTVDHLHIDRRLNGTTGPWDSSEKLPYDWPF